MNVQLSVTMVCNACYFYIFIFQKTLDSTVKTFGFQNKMMVCLQSSNLGTIIDDTKTKILNSLESFEAQGNLTNIDKF